MPRRLPKEKLNQSGQAFKNIVRVQKSSGTVASIVELSEESVANIVRQEWRHGGQLWNSV